MGEGPWFDDFYAGFKRVSVRVLVRAALKVSRMVRIEGQLFRGTVRGFGLKVSVPKTRSFDVALFFIAEPASGEGFKLFDSPQPQLL